MTIRNHFAASAILLLAACGSEPAPDTEAGGKAAGEVLGGTISDDMIALEQLTSQSPPEDSGSGASGAADPQGSAGQEEASAASQPEPDPAPASDPADSGEE